MSTHPYVRGYMAGIVVPTLFLLVVVSVYCVARFGLHVPVPIERVIVFPMAVVPNLWGAWNMLYVRRRHARPVSIGLHGALLPLILAPLGFLAATRLEILPRPSGNLGHESFLLPVVGLSVGITIYYLAWKYLVNFFNALLGIA